MITFTIDNIPPSKNVMHKHDSRSFRVSPEFQEFKEEVMMLKPPVRTLEGDLFIDIAVFLPDRKRDPHNCLDTMLDAIQYSALIKNDRQFRWTLIYCPGIDKAHPRTIVTMGPIDELPDWLQIKVSELRKKEAA